MARSVSPAASSVIAPAAAGTTGPDAPADGTAIRRAASAGSPAPVSASHDRIRASAAGSTPTSSAGCDSAAETRTPAEARSTGWTVTPGAVPANAGTPATSSGRSAVGPMPMRASRGTANAAWSTAPWLRVAR